MKSTALNIIIIPKTLHPLLIWGLVFHAGLKGVAVGERYRRSRTRTVALLEVDSLSKKKWSCNI